MASRNKKSVGRHSAGAGASSQNSSYSSERYSTSSYDPTIQSSEDPFAARSDSEVFKDFWYADHDTSVERMSFGFENTGQIRKRTNTKEMQAARTSRHAKNNKSRGKRNKAKDKKSRTVWTIILIIAIIGLLVGGIWIGLIIKSYSDGRAEYSEVAKATTFDVSDNTIADDADEYDILNSVDFDKLRAQNPDVTAWIYVPGTVINYPIVQGVTNDTYLRTTYLGNSNNAGSIFLDSDEDKELANNQNNIIYGHSMDDGSMFKAILSYKDSDYFKEHQTIYIITEDNVYKLKAIGIYTTSGNDETVRVFNFDTHDELTEYVDSKLKNSTNVVSYNSEGLTQVFSLITCSYGSDNERSVLLCVDESLVEE